MTTPVIKEPTHIRELPKATVMWVQLRLKWAGLDVGVIDGVAGAKTLAALAKFKGDRHLAYPELVGESTIEVLSKIIEPEERSRRTINQAGLDLIKEFEGCKLEAYQCPAKVWTIGYGSTGKHVVKGKRITQQQAEELLREDLERFEMAVERLARVPLNDNEFAALVSFAFNVGIGALERSGLLRKLNARENRTIVASEFLKWNRAKGKVLAGLTRRRQAERALFLRG